MKERRRQENEGQKRTKWTKWTFAVYNIKIEKRVRKYCCTLLVTETPSRKQIRKKDKKILVSRKRKDIGTKKV